MSYPESGPDPLTPRDLNPLDHPANPRDPRGGVGSQLNPTRDHVQGEPEGTTPEANEHAPQAPRTTEPPIVEPPIVEPPPDEPPLHESHGKKHHR